MSLALVRHACSRASTALRMIRAAQQHHGASYPNLVARFLDVYVRRQYSLREILKLDLLDPRHTRAWFDGNISKQGQLDLQVRLNPPGYWVLTEDKDVFYRYCLGAGLLVPRYFGSIAVPAQDAPAAEVARSRAQAIHVLAQADAAELIVKPALGVYGRCVVALRREDGEYLDAQGRRRAADDLPEWLATLGGYDRFVVQDRVPSHPALESLSGTRNLQTVRMATYVRNNGTPVIGCCQL